MGVETTRVTEEGTAIRRCTTRWAQAAAGQITFEYGGESIETAQQELIAQTADIYGATGVRGADAIRTFASAVTGGKVGFVLSVAGKIADKLGLQIDRRKSWDMHCQEQMTLHPEVLLIIAGSQL